MSVTVCKMGSLLQRCNGSMKDVLCEDLLYMVCICSRTSQRAKAFQRYNQYAAYCMSAYRVLDELTLVEMQWVNEGCTI